MNLWSAVMLCTAITTGAGVTAGAKAVLHVSPDGRDDNPGSREEPLASLAGARDRVREVKAAGDAVTVVFAAAAIVALETMIPRLAEDHVRARRLGELLADMDGIRVDMETVQTNIVRVDIDCMTPEEFSERVLARGVGVSVLDAGSVKFLTHRGVDDGDIETAAQVVREVLAAG